MNAGSLNLLRYPRRLRLNDLPQLTWAAVGLVLGLSAASAWGVWSRVQQTDWALQRQALQERLAQQERARTAAAERSRQARVELQAEQREQDWQRRREGVLRLHEVLTQAGRVSGLRLQLWQGDERRLQLQGWLPQIEDVSMLQAQLAAAGPAGWRLQSLASGSGPGVQLVLEAAWPEPGPAKRETGP